MDSPSSSLQLAMAALVGASLMAISAFYIHKRTVDQVLDRLIEIRHSSPSRYNKQSVVSGEDSGEEYEEDINEDDDRLHASNREMPIESNTWSRSVARSLDDHNLLPSYKISCSMPNVASNKNWIEQDAKFDQQSTRFGPQSHGDRLNFISVGLPPLQTSSRDGETKSVNYSSSVTRMTSVGRLISPRSPGGNAFESLEDSDEEATVFADEDIIFSNGHMEYSADCKTEVDSKVQNSILPCRGDNCSSSHDQNIRDARGEARVGVSPLDGKVNSVHQVGNESLFAAMVLPPRTSVHESVNVEDEEVRKMLRERLDLRNKYLYREEVAPWEKAAVDESNIPSLQSDTFHFEPDPATTYCFRMEDGVVHVYASETALMEESHKGDGAKKQDGEEEEEQQIWSWGAGTDGQLGTGNLEDEHFPQLLHLLYPSFVGPISTLACGGAHVIALTSGGKVLTWGRGTSGQLGHGEMLNTLHPKPVNFLDGYVITDVSAGWSHSGFVSDTGDLFTCGDGSFGQLGHGDYQSHATPVKLSYFAHNHVGQIACGMRHSLVLLTDSPRNQVFSFGAGKRGQLGISEDKVKLVCLPQATCGFEDIEITSISANGDHSAALSADENLYIWGRGFPGTSDVNIPRLISSSRFIKVALGWNHALVLNDDGEVFIVGGNRHGALCDLEKINSLKSTEDLMHTVMDRVSSIEGVRVVEIAAGAEHSALLTADGAIMTWGWGEHGQLGLGNTCDHTDPQLVSLGSKPGNQEVSRVYCGSGFTFAVRSFSHVKPA